MTISPRKNKDGEITSYTIRVYRGYDRYGNRLKPYTISWKPDRPMSEKQMEREVNKFAVMFENKCKKGIISSAERITVEEYAETYLSVKKNVLAPTTYNFNKKVLETIIIPALGAHRLAEVRPVHVQAFVDQLVNLPKRSRDGKVTNETIKVSSVNRYLTVLKSLFSLAIKQNLIEVNPTDNRKLELPKAVTPKIEIFSLQEMDKLFECLDKEPLQFRTMIYLAYITGARRGELVGLKFSDVDFEQNKITIQRAAVKVPGVPVEIKAPKDYEERTVSIDSDCMELIRQLKAEKAQLAVEYGNKWHYEDWLFTQWDGTIMNPHTPSKQFGKFLAKYDLPSRKFHALRHTSATLSLYGGIDIKTVCTRLGHSDITTTNKYLHCLADADKEAANVLGGLIKKKNAPEENDESEELKAS